MKQNKMSTFACFVLGFSATAVLVLPLFSQKDFNMDEQRLIERFKRANPDYLEGAKLFAKGNLDKAEKKLMEAIKIMPEHADAYYVMAQIHLMRKAFPEALATITTAKNNYAATAKFHTYTYQEYLERLRDQKKNLEDRRALLQEALSRRPISKGDPDMERGRMESTLQALIQNISTIDSRLSSPIPPTFEIPADYYYIHGNALFRLGRTPEAVAQYKEAIRLDPVHGNAFNNLALVLFSQGNYQEALDCLAQAEAAGVKVNPDFKKAVEAKVGPQ